MRNDPVISEGEQRQFRCLHVLEQLDPAKEDGFRYRCIKPNCGKYMKRKNGVVLSAHMYGELSKREAKQNA